MAAFGVLEMAANGQHPYSHSPQDPTTYKQLWSTLKSANPGPQQDGMPELDSFWCFS